MKLFSNLKNWLRSESEHAGETVLADDVRDGGFAVADSEKMIAQFRSETAKFVGENKRVNRLLGDAQHEVTKWTQIEAAAKAGGNADDQAKAQDNLLQAQRRAITLKQEFDANNKAIQKLRAQISTADTKVANAKGQLVQLAARERGAQVRLALAQASARFGTSNSPLAALDDLQAKVESHEDLASSMEEETTSSTGSDLVSKYAAPDSSVANDYAKMFGASAAEKPEPALATS